MKKEVSKKKISEDKIIKDNPGKKNSDKIVLSVLGGVIVLLVIVTIIVRNSDYYNTKVYNYDYLKFSVSDYYVKSKDQKNYLVKKDDACYIEYNSFITEKKDILNYGKAIKINDYDWIKQDFDNGVRWMSYYKNSIYIVEMYGKDDKLYESECKKDFEKIKSTLSFIKSE